MKLIVRVPFRMINFSEDFTEERVKIISPGTYPVEITKPDCLMIQGTTFGISERFVKRYREYCINQEIEGDKDDIELTVDNNDLVDTGEDQ